MHAITWLGVAVRLMLAVLYGQEMSARLSQVGSEAEETKVAKEKLESKLVETEVAKKKLDHKLKESVSTIQVTSSIVQQKRYRLVAFCVSLQAHHQACKVPHSVFFIYMPFYKICVALCDGLHLLISHSEYCCTLHLMPGCLSCVHSCSSKQGSMHAGLNESSPFKENVHLGCHQAE